MASIWLDIVRLQQLAVWVLQIKRIVVSSINFILHLINVLLTSSLD